jgi:hypothetical protein
MRDHAAHNRDPNHSVKFPSDPLPREQKHRKEAKAKRLAALANITNNLHGYSTAPSAHDLTTTINLEVGDRSPVHNPNVVSYSAHVAEEEVVSSSAMETVDDHGADLPSPGETKGCDGVLPEVNGKIILWDIVDIGVDKDGAIAGWEIAG